MKTWRNLFSASVLALIIPSGPASLAVQNASADTPETVMATFRLKAGQLKTFLGLMPAYREALRKNRLVTDEPYLLMTGTEEDKPIVIIIFSWKNHDIPENVPPDIQECWNRFNTMVEDRDGHSGIEFPEMNLVQPQLHSK